MTRLFFADDNVKKAYNKLQNSEFRDLYKHLSRAFKEIEKNPYGSGITIPKKLIPDIYIKKYGVKRLFKYDLPSGWRLLYTVGQQGVEVIAIILEWMRHKDYERRFGYRSG